jgi:hypothetical protein
MRMFDKPMLVAGGLAMLVTTAPGQAQPGAYDTSHYTGRFTLHAFERLPNGRTMIAESGNQRIIEVDEDGKIVHEIPLVADKPSPTSETRMVRSVPGSGYLVAHEADRKIREYDRNGKVVWEYALQLNGKPESGAWRRRTCRASRSRG